MSKVAIPSTPRLPPEICLDIIVIEWATFVPNALDTHAPDPFAYPAPKSQDDIQQSIRESMYTKRSLVLVCKMWNRLVTPFLYQAISVFRENILTELLYSLKGSDFAADSGSTKGRWARYLFVLLPLDHCGTKDELEQLLRCLPNLQIMIIRQNRHPDDVSSAVMTCLFEALALQTTRSLHVLEIASTGNYTPMEVHGIPEAMKAQPFRVLSIRSLIPFWHLDQLAQACMTHVEYLDVLRRMLDHILAAESLPSALPCFSLNILSHSTDSAVRRTLSRVGHGLTMMEVHDSPYSSADRFEGIVCLITESCPNLRYLMINLKSRILMSTKKLPPVKKLGLRPDTLVRNFTARWQDLCRSIESLVIRTPTVKVVRIFTTPKVCVPGDTGITGTLRQSSIILSKRGVRFEDCTGQLFHSD